MRHMRDKWQMEFVDSGEKALALFEHQYYDAIVTDMRMPFMNGSELLDLVCMRYPETLRVILSGQSERDAILRSLDCTHRYHSKPCEADSIVAMLTDAFNTLFSGNSTLRSKLTGLRELPYRADVGAQIKALSRTKSDSLAELTNLVSHDVALTIRILHLANSSFISAPGEVPDISSAVMLLGQDGIAEVNDIVHARNVSNFGCSSDVDTFANDLGEHSYRVACAAARIAKVEKCTTAEIAEIFTAGILHDAGKLALLACMETSYRELLAQCIHDQTDAEQMEQMIYGFDHAEAGRYVLSLLGISKSVVDAATLHHRPSKHSSTVFSAAAAVHFADALFRGNERTQSNSGTQFIDMEYLHHIGCADRTESWQYEALRGIYE